MKGQHEGHRLEECARWEEDKKEQKVMRDRGEGGLERKDE
jgi:hypothetical protein